MNSSAEPVANEFVLRGAGGGALADLDEVPSFEEPDCFLNGGFGEAAGFGDLAEAHRDATFACAKERGPEDDIDEKCRRRAVVADQVGHEDVEDVLVDCNVRAMGHLAIVRNDTAGLQQRRVGRKNACRRRER